jgi:hypothetical protein
VVCEVERVFVVQFYSAIAVQTKTILKQSFIALNIKLFSAQLISCGCFNIVFDKTNKYW